MSELDVTLAGKSLADYTNTQLRLALGAVLYTNTAEMWKKYLNQLGYSGDVSQMLQKYYVDYAVPSNFRNYINAGASIFNPQNMFSADAGLQGYVYDLNDLSTLFTDSALTVPATVNGLVGGVVDKSGRGNNATQATTGNKPVLRGSPIGANLVTNGDFASGTTGWSALNATLSNVANRLRVTAVANGESSASFAIATTAGGVYRITVDFVTDAVTGSTFLYAGTSAGSAGLLNVNLLSTPRTAVAYFTATGTTSYITLASSSGALAAEYNEWDNVEVKDVSEGQVQAPYALQFDGVDDFLQTASVNFTATDKMTVCHGVQNDGTATAVVAELSPTVTGTNGAFALFSNNIGAGNMMWGIRNTVSGDEYLYYSNGTNPSKGVLTASLDINNATKNSRIIGRRNGVVQGTTYGGAGTTTGGNFGNHAFYFGRRGGTSLPYNGLFFSAICVGKAVSATELANIERWTNSRTRAY